MHTALPKKALLERITRIEEAIVKGHEYLKNGAHAEWHGFRAIFFDKYKDGKLVPPHPDWVKNVFLPAYERRLKETERLLDRLNLEEQKKRR